MNNLRAALRDPQVVARDLIVSAHHPDYGEYSCTRGPLPDLATERSPAGAPLPGEHTREVLDELGYYPQRIESRTNGCDSGRNLNQSKMITAAQSARRSPR